MTGRMVGSRCLKQEVWGGFLTFPGGGEAAGGSWQRGRSGTAVENETLLGNWKGGERGLQDILFNFLCCSVNVFRKHLGGKNRHWFQELIFFFLFALKTGLDGGS